MARPMQRFADEDRMNPTKNRAARRTRGDVDAALAAAAQGVAPTSDDAADLPDGEELRETDVIGRAAGVVVADGKPLGGPDEIELRDAHRWELDPASAEDFASAHVPSLRAVARGSEVEARRRAAKEDTSHDSRLRHARQSSGPSGQR